MITIRNARPSDMKALCRMALSFYAVSCYAQNFKDDIGSFAATVADLATSGTGVVLVAESDGVICGMAGAMLIKPWFSPQHKTGQELFWWVDEDHRKTRAGLSLMKALEAWAIECGCKTFSMCSTANLEPDRLAQLYKRLGYVPQDIFYIKAL